ERVADFFFSSRRRHTSFSRDWSSDVCSSDLADPPREGGTGLAKNKLGIAGIVFFVVAAAAPLVGMTGAVPIAIVLGNGPGVPGEIGRAACRERGWGLGVAGPGAARSRQRPER